MDQRERWNDPQEALRVALDGHQGKMWTAMPGIVVSRDGNNATIQLAIKAKLVDVSGNFADVPYTVLPNVPLVMPGGGGFGVTFPIGAGDEVLVVFASRCIDGWWQQGGVQPQTEVRMHDINDGFAIPCPMSQPKAMPNISSDSAQLRTNDGTSYVSVGQGGSIEAISNSGSISLTAGGDIDVTATGNLTVKATGTLTLDGQSVVITSGVVQIFDLPGAPSQPGQLFVQGKTVMYN